MIGRWGEEMTEERMMKWFRYEHLPEQLQAGSKPFGELAQHIVDTIYAGSNPSI